VLYGPTVLAQRRGYRIIDIFISVGTLHTILTYSV